MMRSSLILSGIVIVAVLLAGCNKAQDTGGTVPPARNSGGSTQAAPPANPDIVTPDTIAPPTANATPNAPMAADGDKIIMGTPKPTTDGPLPIPPEPEPMPGTKARAPK